MAPPRESDQGHATAPAPWFRIPNNRFICIEHPAKIRNIDRALATIGGERALEKLVETSGESSLELRLRPWDPFQPPIEARTVRTSNVLLKISIPKRRRRKRLHGQGGQGNLDLSKDSNQETLYDKLQRCSGNYTIEPIGIISHTVRFRDIADFQYSTIHSNFANKFKETLVGCTYENIKRFRLDPEDPTQPADIMPPPAFSRTVIPHIYNYHQNPAVKRAIIDGQATLLNLQTAPKTLTTMVHMSSITIPSGPPENTPEISTLDHFTRSCIDHLKRLFSSRPIWTRRALVNNFPSHLHPMIRFSMVHVAYMWRAGPWRDTCVVYGIDPRNDPKYRKYQSIFFQFEVDSKMKARDKNSHIFDGKILVKDGRCFQLCDITDPLLKSLIDREKLRDSCHSQDGWYRSGTIIKIKRLMRQKIKALVDNTSGLEVEENFASILEADSNEDEEGNQKPKINIGPKRRGRKTTTPINTKQTPSRVDVGDAMEGDQEGEDDEEAERNDDWEEGTAMLESEWNTETVDRRVDEFMLELMKQGNDHDFDAPQEEDFDIFEGSSEDDA